MILDTWLSLIPNKVKLSIKLDDIFNKLYKNIKKEYIISFDVEFIRIKIHDTQVRTVHEMGGIILVKKENNWYLSHIFHLNLPPIISDPKKIYFLSSTYCTLSEKNTKIIEKIEKKLLPHYELIKKGDVSDKKIVKILNKYKLCDIYLSNEKIKKLLEKKNTNFNKFIKDISKLKHLVYGNDLVNYREEYKLYKKMLSVIFNDEGSLARTIELPNEFIKLTNKLFSQSYLIVKGIEDFKAIKNHGLLLNVDFDDTFDYFDIAKFNQILFEKCDSAELEKTYLCLEKLNHTKIFDKYLSAIKEHVDLKAHNPLTDAYYTWIIFTVLKE